MLMHSIYCFLVMALSIANAYSTHSILSIIYAYFSTNMHIICILYISLGVTRFFFTHRVKNGPHDLLAWPGGWELSVNEPPGVPMGPQGTP